MVRANHEFILLNHYDLFRHTPAKFLIFAKIWNKVSEFYNFLRDIWNVPKLNPIYLGKEKIFLKNYETPSP